jgi:hypothetical protein
MRNDWDNVTEVKQTSWISRLGSSLIGALIGIGLVIGAVILLYWNEGRAVDAATALEAGAAMVEEVSPGATPSAMEGKLVHIVGLATSQQPARDRQFDISAPDLLLLSREVEMYQWHEDSHSETETSTGGAQTTRTTYTYSKDWSANQIASSSFKQPGGHSNPSMPFTGAMAQARNVFVEQFPLGATVIEKLDAFEPYVPDAHAMDQAGFRRVGEEFYAGANPSRPQIGDLRVRFYAVRSQTISVVAGVSRGSLQPFHGKKGYDIALISPGHREAAEMFDQAQDEEATLTWILRVVGSVAMLIGFVMIANPLVIAVSVLPVLAPIASVGTFVFAIVLTVPLSLVTIAIAWVAHRPLLSLVLALIAGGVMVLAVVLSRGKPSSRIL